MIRFILALFALAIMLAALVLSAVHMAWIPRQPSFFYQTLIFLVFSTGLIYRYLYKASRPEFFVQLYLLTMAVKILAYGVYAYIMISKDAAGAALNVVFFMITYFCFTALEITFLYRKISSGHTS